MANDDVHLTHHLKTVPPESSRDFAEELSILRALADGRDPLTGTVLPNENCYQSAKVLRALLAAIKSLEKRSRSRHLPANAGKPWTEQEDGDLIEAFVRKVPISELAKKHQRTQGAISSRLEKLGKIPPAPRG